MATKTKTAAKKGNKPNVAKKVNNSLVNASLSAINTTIDNGEKWQKLASKLIKKSEKVREQQINMIFETAETVKGQFISGTEKMKDLVGYDAELVEKAKDMAINNPVSRRVAGIVEDISEKVSENPMVQKAEKATEDLKNMGMAKFNDVKEDVLEQASKIINRGEAIIEEAKSTPKAKVTKKGASKKTVAKKATATKAKATKTVAKSAPKKTAAKKATVAKVKVTKTVSKAAPKKTVAKKATATKAKTTKTVSKASPKKTVAKKATATKAKETKTISKAAPKKVTVKKATPAKATPAKATTSKATKVAPKATVAKTATEVKKEIIAKVAEVKVEVKK
jgi:hypothetical protein